MLAFGIRAIIVFLLAGGCNSVFGLDPVSGSVVDAGDDGGDDGGVDGGIDGLGDDGPSIDGRGPEMRTISTCAGGAAFVVGDFNRDSNPDIVIGCGNDDHLHVLLGSGARTFSDVPGPEAKAIVAMAVVDFNGDQDPDLAAIAPSEAMDNVTVFSNDGSGSFTRLQGFDVANLGPALVAARVSTTAPSLFAYAKTGLLHDFRSNGAGFDLPTSYAPGMPLDGLVAGTFVGGNGNIALGHDGGTYIYARQLAGGLVINSTLIGGVPLAAGKFGTDLLDHLVMRTPGAGDLTGAITHTLATVPAHAAVGDLDGDGDLDLALSPASGNGLTILRVTGADGIEVPLSTSAHVENVVVTDLDGDGATDIIAAIPSLGELDIWFGPN